MSAKGSVAESVTRLVKTELHNLADAAVERATDVARERVGGLTHKLTEAATHKLTGVAEERGPGAVAALKGAEEMAGGGSPGKAMLKGGWAGIKRLFGKGKGGTRKQKLTNIVEWADVGVPRRLAYNQWTEFGEFPRFMKKVEKVDRESDEKYNWRAQIFLSHRDWKAHIIHMEPDERIVWRSEGAKGHVDGAVSFHELTPDLTRIALVLEYYPKGLFEHTGNIWRAPGRRARLEFKHFVRHAMTKSVVNPDEIEGWRGRIRDGEVTEDHDTVKQAEEEQERQQQEQEPEPEPQEQGEEQEEEQEPEEEEQEEEQEPEEEEPQEQEAQKEDEQEPEEQEAPEERQPRRKQKDKP